MTTTATEQELLEGTARLEAELFDYCESVENELALANAIAFHYLELQQREFPPQDEDYEYV